MSKSWFPRIEETLRHATGEERRNVVLAALAELSARYLEPSMNSQVPVKME